MEPNHLLRAAREACPSPSAPGEPLSRAELAEAVNDHLWRATGKRHALDAHAIARYERGKVRWPSPAYRAGIKAILRVASHADLGFHSVSRGRVVSRGSTASVRSMDLIEQNGRLLQTSLYFSADESVVLRWLPDTAQRIGWDACLLTTG